MRVAAAAASAKDALPLRGAGDRQAELNPSAQRSLKAAARAGRLNPRSWDEEGLVQVRRIRLESGSDRL
ncbi:hypothetical protein ACFPYJ_25475 [Paenibacillus solisilvae]|uniref:Uncharacterized protein n=1 Tax=Paenibacillus solisilvae TaxID=2486751 RepID=A0ABW0W7T0_9BACL